MDNLSLNTIQTQLTESLPLLERKILVREIKQLSIRLNKKEGLFVERILAVLDEVAVLRYEIYSEFQKLDNDLPKLRTKEEKIERCMEFLKIITPTANLKADRQAFKRWMDIAAVRERARVAMHESDRTGEMVINLLRQTLLSEFQNLTPDKIYAEIERMKITKILEAEFNDSPRWQNQVVVLKVWEALIRSLPVDKRSPIWSPAWECRIADIMSSPEENTWLQIQAFQTMAVYNKDKCLAVIYHRFKSPDQSGDDIFLRTGLIELVYEEFSNAELHLVLRDIFQRPDPSEHVRIKAGLKLASLSVDQALSLIANILNPPAKTTETEKVLAAVAISLGKLAIESEKTNAPESIISELLDLIELSLTKKPPEKVEEALFEGLKEFAAVHAARCPMDHIDALDHRILKSLDNIISNSDFHDRVRRLASETREWIILNRDPDARDLMKIILDFRSEVPFGESFKIESDLIPGEIMLGRILAWASTDDYGYYAKPGKVFWQIWRGEHFKRKAWRIIHELTNPDPAKRQGFIHSTGRSFPGRIRAHARYLSEITETKVPGERLFRQEEYSWRPYLPTVDDLLSLSSSKFAGKTIKIFSSEGVFSLRGPTAFQDRFMMWWEITLNYSSIVKHRNVTFEDVTEGQARNFAQYIVENHNIEIGFEPHNYEYKGRFYQVIDPVVASHLKPVVKNQAEWRPLS